MKLPFSRLLFLCLLLLVSGPGVTRASDMAVSMDDILLLSQRGMSDQTILVFVQSRDINFAMDADDMDRLLQAGISEEVIRYLVQRTAPTRTYTSRPVTYVDPYPAYYYTPYYAGTTLLLGFSAYPSHYYGYYPSHSYGYRHYGAGHHGQSLHSRPSHYTHNGYGNAHRTHDNTRGVSHSAGHGGSSRGHLVASAGHSQLSGVGHGSRSGGHRSSSNAGHSSSVSAGHDSGAGHSSSGAGHSSGGGHSGGFGGGHSGGGHGGGH